MTENHKQARRVILLAEDDMEMRLLLSLTLQKEGYSVIECNDGVNLSAQLESLLNGEIDVEYDLIVTDIRMPGVSGLEVVQGLAGLPGCPLIILITAFGNPETHEPAHQLGVAAVLDKPFEIEDFTKLVHDVLMMPKKEKQFIEERR
jgi:CheY-like chemotaxis protein